MKNLLGYVHQNFIAVVELILSKLPQENLKNSFAQKLQVIMKQRRKKVKKETAFASSEGPSGLIKNYNEMITNLLKTIVR